jgi:hypothetical protein
VKFKSAADRTALEALVKAYGSDAVILELAQRAEASGDPKDPAHNAILQRFAASLRGALRQRDESHALVSYRRDWRTDQWVRWLDGEATREGLVMTSEYEAALKRAGCASPRAPAQCYVEELQSRAVAERGNELPATPEQWGHYIRARESEVSRARSIGELMFWLLAQGHPGKLGDAHKTLQHNRERLPASIRALVPVPKQQRAEQSAPSAPPPDPDDKSMFEAPEAD